MDKERYQIIRVVFLLGAAILLIQVASIQLFNPRYRQKAETTTIQKEVLYPSRGLIFDRNGTPLVVNAPRYQIKCIYDQVSRDMDTVKFCSLLGITEDAFNSRINKDWSSPIYSKTTPFTFVRNVSARKFATLQEHLHEFPGFFAVERNIRQYPHQSACHVLGFINEVDEDILEDSTDYALGDYIGRSGVEKEYEPILRGSKGIRLIMKDNMGRSTGRFNDGEMDVDPVNGSDIILSIDLPLQEYVEYLMEDLVGSVVVLEPSTGEVLAMVSSPFYDPNIMTSSLESEEALKDLLSDTLKPFFDRSIMAKYPPASIFKPVMGLVAMSEGVANPNTSVYCPGYYQYESFRYGCRQHPYPRNMDIALRFSCNSYFFQLFRNTIEHHGYKNHDKGLDILVDYLGEFGLGSSLGVDLPGEVDGFVPTSRFYDDLYKQYQWKSTYIMSIGIGQGELQLTTLQMANLAAILANRGTFISPHLIKGFMDVDKALPPAYKKRKKIDMDPALFETVNNGMENTVLKGTAYQARIPDIAFCGKTGTSQNPSGEDHSVFFGFAPKENPSVAVAVYIENAGSGGAVAAPIASLVVEKYLKGEVTRPELERRMKKIKMINRPQS